MGLGALVSGTYKITDNMFSAAAHALRDLVSQDELDHGFLLPPIGNIRNVSATVALAVAKVARDSGLGLRKDDNSLKEMIQNAMWAPKYLPYRYMKHKTII